MRIPKEIAILALLLLTAIAGVLWYVIDRREKLPAKPAPPTATAPQRNANPPVDLTKHDGQTIDFSSGKPVVKNTPEDKAALNAALKDIQDASKTVTFEAPKPKQPANAQPVAPY